MSVAEVKKSPSPRSLEEIQNAYGGLCAKAGDLQYKIRSEQKNLDMVLQQIQDLNFEYLAAKKAADEAAQAAADAPKAEEAAANA